MEAGWVYVLVNSSIPGLAKVGRTSRDPDGRAAELSAVTGVPTPFVVAFDQHFSDCHQAEQFIHDEMDRRGWRAAPNREFFRAPASDIVRLVLEAGATLGATLGDKPDRPQAASEANCTAILEAGDQALFGRGDAMQDTGEAARCYKLAAALGSAVAYERLGGIYLRLYGVQRNRAGRRRALAPLQEGARRGNAYCYVDMSELFALEGHRDNFLKSWQLFFTQVRLDDASGTELPRFAEACGRYIGLCLDLVMEPGYLPVLRSASDAILSCMLAELERHRANDAKRAHAASKLRWVYEVLLGDVSALAAAQTVTPRRRWWVRQAGVAAA
jgi:hypothetical protein